METPVVLPHAREGIYGVLHVPAGFETRPRRTGVLMVHAEGGSKIGHKRSFVELARHLETRGVATLRFDLLGEGESEDLAEDPYHCWRGLRPAVDHLWGALDLEHLLLVGDCFGGLLAVHYARIEPRVEQVVVWNLAQTKWTPEQLRGFEGEAGPGLEEVRRYWHKLAAGETWRKLVTGRLHFRVLLRRAVAAPAAALAARLRRAAGSFVGPGRRRPPGAAAAAGGGVPRYRVPVLVFHAAGTPAGRRTLEIARHVFGGLGVEAEHAILPGVELSTAWKRGAFAAVDRRIAGGEERE